MRRTTVAFFCFVTLLLPFAVLAEEKLPVPTKEFQAAVKQAFEGGLAIPGGEKLFPSRDYKFWVVNTETPADIRREILGDGLVPANIAELIGCVENWSCRELLKTATHELATGEQYALVALGLGTQKVSDECERVPYLAWYPEREQFVLDVDPCFRNTGPGNMVFWVYALWHPEYDVQDTPESP